MLTFVSTVRRDLIPPRRGLLHARPVQTELILEEDLTSVSPAQTFPLQTVLARPARHPGNARLSAAVTDIFRAVQTPA